MQDGYNIYTRVRVGVGVGVGVGVDVDVGGWVCACLATTLTAALFASVLKLRYVQGFQLTNLGSIYKLWCHLQPLALLQPRKLVSTIKASKVV